MEQKNLIDVAKFISATHRSLFDERRRIEWRVLLSTLGLYAGSAAAKLTGDVDLGSNTIYTWLVWAVFLLFGLIASIYLSYLNKANEVNQRFAHAAEKILMDMSEKKEFKNVLSNLPKFIYRQWSLTWEVITIFTFAITSSVIITIQ